MHTTVQKNSPALTHIEIEQLVKNDLPPLPDIPLYAPAGDFAQTYRWLAQAQHKTRPDIRRPRIALFTTAAMLEQDVVALTPQVQVADADFNVYELGTGADYDFAHALAYGMMAVQPGVDIVAVAASSTDSFQHADVAALAGCIIAARLARIPVLTEGAGAGYALSFLCALHKDATAHCRDVDLILKEKTLLPVGGKLALVLPLLKALTRI